LYEGNVRYSPQSLWNAEYVDNISQHTAELNLNQSNIERGKTYAFFHLYNPTNSVSSQKHISIFPSLME